ncbi:hypothetical protein [Actinopolymorpha rutila]|uniref:Uncharacterized protein n=1 Tax=Actinopolymorpha rutila TaxID=446787 RepID=A0A852ZSY2_9ACTN|nr:hypothetical protein [Actinopolymorpha rutila]NYH92509.1 hypothetical protein [Actinopolymorpha rutila]
MATKPVNVSIGLNAGALVTPGQVGKAESRHVCSKLRQRSKVLTGKKAALVLIFGGATKPGPGQQVASAIGKQLHCANADIFAPQTPFRAFWDGSLDYGQARLEVFVFTTKQSASAG